MAKVTGPLQSFTASGKVADSIVFSNWKGTATVRRYTIPANPQTADQGDQRIIVGGTGRACGKVAVGSAVATQLAALNVIPSDQSKQSFLVKYIVTHFMQTPTAYAAILAELAGHSAAADFASAGDTLGIVDFDLSYASVAPFTKGVGVYVMAKALISLGLTGSPYDTALSSWTSTEIGELVADMQA